MDRCVDLDTLYTPKGPSNLDILLIHGVNGDRVKTWRDPQSGIFWPQDWLPLKFPQARVLSFGYNADMYRNNSAAGIRDNARTLLSFLCLEREDLDSPTPIVFIAHCLGGLIVKQALYFAEFDSDPTYEDAAIHLNTYLTVFFGTPNQGTHKDNWRHIANVYGGLEAGILAPYNRGKRSALVETLLRQSDELAEINEKFRQLTDHYDISNFFENKTWGNTDKLIVGPTDAQIGVAHEQLRPVDGDHVTICQFRNPKDRTFALLCSDISRATEIKAVAAQLPGAQPSRPRQVATAQPTPTLITAPTRGVDGEWTFTETHTQAFENAHTADGKQEKTVRETVQYTATKVHGTGASGAAYPSNGGYATSRRGPGAGLASGSGMDRTHSQPPLMLEGKENGKPIANEGSFGTKLWGFASGIFSWR